MVSEAALAHVIGDKTEAAYRRGDIIEKRRRLMGCLGKVRDDEAGGRHSREVNTASSNMMVTPTSRSHRVKKVVAALAKVIGKEKVRTDLVEQEIHSFDVFAEEAPSCEALAAYRRRQRRCKKLRRGIR